MNMMTNAEQKLGRGVTRMLMTRGFSRYNPEIQQPVRQVEVKEDETLRQLKEAWRSITFDVFYIGSVYPKFYDKVFNAVKNIHYSARDVENFSIALAEFQDEEGFVDKSGYFLSALINNSSDSDFVVHTAHLQYKVNFLGYENTKNITIEGDVGRFLGNQIISGNISINGNTGRWVGAEMRGGNIRVKGNTGLYPGCNMKGGEIHIEGTIKGFVPTHSKGGKIYEREVLIYPKENGEEK